MHIIEPCCTRRHLLALRNAIGKNGTADFEGYDDLSLTELLPALLLRYDDVEMMIIAPELPDQAAEVIDECMRKRLPLLHGSGKIDVIRHLTIVTSLDGERSPRAALWKEENPFGDRLTLVDCDQENTTILLPDIALYGPINLRYGRRFTATATTQMEMVERLWNRYRKLTEPAEEPADEQEPESQEGRKASKRRKKD